TAARAVAREFRLARMESRVLQGCNLVIVAGGGQLDDYWGGAWGHPYVLWKWLRRARARGVPVAIIGTGFGTARTRTSRWLLKGALRAATHVSIRDEGSMVLAHALGAWVPLKFCPDLAFNLPAPARRARAARLVGVSPMAYADPRAWPEKDPSRYHDYVQRLAATVRLLVEDGESVGLFSTDGPDRTTVAEIAALVPAHVESGRVRVHDTPTAASVIALASELDVVIASRLHGAVLSLVATCPVIALSYERKVDRVMQDFGLADLALPIETFVPAAVVAKVAHVHSDRARIEHGIERRVSEYRWRLGEEYARVFRLAGR
ncbi:MAG TPA: polysaccharide pyruvyl transferase family protein, partial [Gemmatimonadaceae bacterium]|nr:polysaccharide pyruvyl transferase family protein [Gemmatimonadaceae bacterium]